MTEIAQMAPPAKFGQWLKVEREARGWSQPDAARVVGVHWNTWARWERGEIVPSELTQAGIRAALARHNERRGKRG